jgi:hypothetical protein
MPNTTDKEVSGWEDEQERTQATELNLNLWRLCDDLTVIQAALLVAGCDPSGTDGYAEDLDAHKRPAGYEAAKNAISNALRRATIEGQWVPLYNNTNGNRSGAIEGSLDVSESRIDVGSLKKWMMNRGIRTGFFFPVATDAPDYLDPMHQRYAPKLAAAVAAWLAVEDPKGRHPKQALAKWLRENAVEFGLSDDEGKPNEQGIEECAKVANWQPGGGAPKTPVG